MEEASINWMRRFGILEASACLLLILGVMGDHVSTMLVLSRPGTYEANPMAARLMELGLWLPLDLILLGMGLAIPYFVTRVDRRLRPLFLYPLIQGLLRLSMALWNLHLLLILRP